VAITDTPPRGSLWASAWLLIAVIGCVLVIANLIVQFGLARVAANRTIVIMLSEVGFAALAAWQHGSMAARR
jgi:hypothetical protein